MRARTHRGIRCLALAIIRSFIMALLPEARNPDAHHHYPSVAWIKVLFPPILHVRDWISDSKIVIFILTPLYSIAVDAIAIYLTLGILNKLYGRRNTQIFKQYFNDFLKTLVIYRSLTFVDLTAELYVKGCARAGMDGKTTYDFASFFRHKTMLTGAFRVSIDRDFPGANDSWLAAQRTALRSWSRSLYCPRQLPTTTTQVPRRFLASAREESSRNRAAMGVCDQCYYCELLQENV